MLSNDDLAKYLQKMLAVVAKGKQVQAAGTHYLWGAQRLNGFAPMLPDVLSTDPSATFMRCASLYLGNTKDGVCAGRCNAADVVQKPQWDKRDKKAPGAQFRWPRYFVDTSKDNSPKVPSALVWGEDCNGKLHFDCGGFVRYCFRQVLGDAKIPDLMRPASDLVWSADNTPGPIASVRVWPADLLYDDGYTHVGIATGHASLSGVSNPNKAVHCYSATFGVVETPIDAFVRWKYVYRWPKWA